MRSSLPPLLTSAVVALVATLLAPVPAQGGTSGPEATTSGSTRINVVRERVGGAGELRPLVTPTVDLARTLRELRADPRNVIVEVDHRRYPLATTGELSPQWSLPAIAWPAGAAAMPAAPLAVIDSGFDLAHRDLVDPTTGASRFRTVWNATDNSTRVEDQLNHGTGVASVAAATANDGFGMVGVAPAAPLLGVKIASSSGTMYVSHEVAAIRWAVAQGARVINVSLGSDEPSEVEHLAIREATAAGVLVVVAAGNQGCSRNLPQYPAAYAESLAVSATAPDGTVPCFSSTGSYVDVAAPGTDISIAEPGGGHGYRNGTSFAAPHVAAAAALLFGARPDLTPQQVADVLRSSAHDVDAPGTDPRTGAGIIDVQRALAALPGIPLPAPAPKPKTPSASSGGRSFGGTGPGSADATRMPLPYVAPDRYEPNDSVRLASRLRVTLDLRRRVPARKLAPGQARLRASIARRGDASDIYAIALPRGRKLLRVSVAERSNARASLRIEVLARGRDGRLRVRCAKPTGRAGSCPVLGATRLWVRISARSGATKYQLRAAA
ncbi:MAG: peptidase [Thermoleophilia bacterium]|nr:peptidase [Thermoleophilia bacterium]